MALISVSRPQTQVLWVFLRQWVGERPAVFQESRRDECDREERDQKNSSKFIFVAAENCHLWRYHHVDFTLPYSVSFGQGNVHLSYFTFFGDGKLFILVCVRVGAGYNDPWSDPTADNWQCNSSIDYLCHFVPSKRCELFGEDGFISTYCKIGTRRDWIRLLVISKTKREMSNRLQNNCIRSASISDRACMKKPT